MLVIKRDVLQHVIIRQKILVKNDTLVFLNLLLDFCSWRKGNLNRQFHANMHVNNLFIYLGDSGENSPVCPINNVLKNFFSIQSEWHYYYTTSLEIIAFSWVYLNLDLSVYQEFIGYGAMVKILLNLKSLCAICYLQIWGNIETLIAPSN